MNFTRVSIGDDFVLFNDSYFNISSNDYVDIWLKKINQSTSGGSLNDLIISFNASAEAGTVTWFNISGLKSSQRYNISKDGVFWKGLNTTVSGDLHFNNTVWSGHTFNITFGELPLAPASSGSSVFNVNLYIINPNPGNGTHSKNYLRRDLTGLTTSVDVTYNNFTTPASMIPGTYSLEFDSSQRSNGATIWNDSAAYADAWDNHSGQPVTGPLYVGQYQNAGVYGISRAFLMFNTSLLPDDAVISSAHVSMVVWDDLSGTDFDVVIQTVKPPCPRNPLIPVDYWKQGFAGNRGSLNTSGRADENWFNISLNAGGLGDINKTGFTYWGLRSDRDIADDAPAGATWEWTALYAPNGVVPWKCPHLIINFTVPSSAWAHIVNLTFYTNESGAWVAYNRTNVTSNGTITVPAPAFDAVDIYYWNCSWNSNHTNSGESDIWTFETVATSGGTGGSSASTKRTTTYFVLGACMGTLTGGLVLNIWRKKKRQ